MTDQIRSAGRTRPALLPFQWFAVLVLLSLMAIGVTQWVVAKRRLYSSSMPLLADLDYYFDLGLAVKIAGAGLVFYLYYANAGRFGLRHQALLGQLHFWTFLAGAALLLRVGLVNLFPPPGPPPYAGWIVREPWRSLNLAGSGVMVLSLLCFAIGLADALRRRFRH